MADDLDKVRKDYEELFGKKPFNGWDVAELQKRIDEKLAADEAADGSEPSAMAGAPAPYPSQAEIDAIRAGTYRDRELKPR